jgi:predicted TIM-barrel fold metal-dependent hydrolase
VPKTDVHFHYNSTDTRFLRFADSLNFKLVSPNVDSEFSIDKQFDIAQKIRQNFPDKFAFLATFPVDKFDSPDFASTTIRRIARCMKSGASGIKIWKNIGMSLRDKGGKFVMADDLRFDSVYSYLEKYHIPLIAHLGEPKNCWLAVEQMTTGNDKNYFSSHPQYHMFLHPEYPSYEDQIRARNQILRKYPVLEFVGAHLGSEEWSVERQAASLDSYPNLKMDMAARISHLQYQSSTDREKVRNFLIKYQDRIIYGTDLSVSEQDNNPLSSCERMKKTWLNHWIYLATDSSIVVKEMNGAKVMGLQLPKEVIDKIFCKNAEGFWLVPTNR